MCCRINSTQTLKKGVKTFSSRSKYETPGPIEGDRFSQNGSLQIIIAEKRDSGKYVCVASNREGKSSIAAMLDVKGISAA